MTVRRPNLATETRLAHAAAGAGATLPAETVAPAIQRGSTVLAADVKGLYAADKPTYGRQGLASQKAFAAGMCELEGAEFCQLYGSGLAAVTGALMSVLHAGDTLLVTDGVYDPVRNFCESFLTRFGVSVVYYPATAAPEEIFAVAPPSTRALLLESPSSLTFEMVDVPAVAKLARDRGILTLIDNTWGAGLVFKPLDHGVDMSIQALTKYVCGHSDVFLGSVCVRDAKLEALLKRTMIDAGFGVSGEDAYLGLRGLRTLHARFHTQAASALKIARWLETHPAVARVLYPALPSDPGHALWQRDFTGACSLFTLDLHPAPADRVVAAMEGLSLFGLGFSWGGFESLVVPAKPRRAGKPFPSGPLVRLHIGLENPDDLMADIEDAFQVLR